MRSCPCWHCCLVRCLVLLLDAALGCCVRGNPRDILLYLASRRPRLFFVNPFLSPHPSHAFRCAYITSHQVKTLSFLTYLLRGFTPLMQPYEKQISSSVINLLKNCPADAVATRKELLVATRHILATEFRKGFFSEVCGVHCCLCTMLHGRASLRLRLSWWEGMGMLIHIQKNRASSVAATVLPRRDGTVVPCYCVSLPCGNHRWTGC